MSLIYAVTIESDGQIHKYRQSYKPIDRHNKDIRKVGTKIYYFYIFIIIQNYLYMLPALLYHLSIFTQPLRSGRIWHKVNF